MNLLDRDRLRSVSMTGDTAIVDGASVRVERLGDGRVRVTDASGTDVAWATVEGHRVFVTLGGRDYVLGIARPGAAASRAQRVPRER